MATAVLLGGTLPGAQASQAWTIDAELAYTCDSPAGKQPVKVAVTAELPDSARSGEAIQPEGVALEVTLPKELLAGTRGSDVAAVTAETRLAVDVAQKGQHARTEWIGNTAESVPVPDDEDALALRISGSVPYVRPGASGDLSFAAGALSVELAVKTANGTPAEPRGVSLTCVLEAGADPALATVNVAGQAESSPGTPSTSAEPSTGEEEEQEVDAPEVGARAEEPAATNAPKCVGDVTNDLEMDAYVTGYANVTKLKGANKFPLACSRIYTYPGSTVFEPPYIHVNTSAAVVLDYKGKPQLPPTTGTFLTFGFMPTTATLEMTQIPPRTDTPDNPNAIIHTVIDLGAGSSSRTDTTIGLDFVLRLRDVKVNGTSLDVGDNCRTERPFKLSLKGVGLMSAAGVLDGYQLTAGGPLTGSVTIPPFKGCGVGEDLDNLFTASLSGVPGFVKQTQGAPCIAASDTQCTPDKQPADIPKAAR
ncbi:DUF6801 domain-containing protein [Streptomyces sp. NPDC091267]|uniref:DUF6801 domain-containing protein n=1 Tax=Streptomyces sp. NPDC091267 TaxID=3155195 RepID=UPI00344608E3